MIRLTLFLCAALFLVMLIGGEDRGQLRPGLAGLGEGAQRIPAPAPVAEAYRPLAETRAATPSVTSGQAEPAFLAAAVAPVAQEEPVAREETLTPSLAAVALAPAAPEVFTLSSFAEEDTSAVATAPADTEIRYVTGRSVNVRSGPGTGSPVIARLTRGEAVSVVRVDDTGWSRILIEGDGLEGFIASDFLADEAP